MCLVTITQSGCIGPFSRDKSDEDQAISIFDEDKFMDINEFDFPEYEWGRDAKAVEEIYVDAMVEYFFRKRYEKAILVLNSALKIYKKDARVYTRLMECYARLHQEQEALNTMAQANAEIHAFETFPGISRYRYELEKSLAIITEGPVEVQRGFFGRMIRWPAKLWPF